MNTTYMKFIAPLAVAFVAAGCLDNPLDLLNPNQRTVEEFWQTEGDAEDATTAVYRSLGDDGMYGRNGYWVWARADAHMSRSPASALQALTRGIVTNLNYSSYGTRGLWDAPYQSIFRANQVIHKVPEMDADAISSSLKDQFVAEAKFVRAIDFFELAIRFGGVPIVTELVEAGDQPVFSSQADVYAQVISDAMDAAAVLPWTWSGDDKGRATRGGALALAAEGNMMLHQWAQAASLLQQITSSGQYTLLPDFGDLYRIPEGENSAESLFEFACGTIEQHNLGARGCTNPRLVAPSTGTGTSIGFNDTQPTWWGFQQFFVEGGYPNNPDPRLQYTIFWNDPNVPGGQGMDVFGQPFFDRYRNTGPDGTPGFRDTDIDHTLFWKKYQEYWKTTYTDFLNAVNVKIYRLSQAYVMLAEALTETGDVAGAKAALDVVRARVGLDPVPAGMSQSEMRAWVNRENVLELMWDGNVRMAYLLRQGLMTKEYFSEYVPPPVDGERNPFVAALFQDGKNDRLPIPQYELDRNPNAHQNPGW